MRSNEDPVQSKINKIRGNKEQTNGSAQQHVGTSDGPETERKLLYIKGTMKKKIITVLPAPISLRVKPKILQWPRSHYS